MTIQTDYMKEYRVSFALKLFLWFFSLAVAIAGAFFLYRAFKPASGEGVLFLFLGVLLLGAAWLMYLGAVRTRVTLDERTLVLQRPFSTRTIPLDTIEGYRRGEKGVLYFQLKTGKRMPLPTSLGNYDDLGAWLKNRYPDLDAKEFETESKAMLADDRYGITEEERKTVIQKAKVISIGMTVIAIIFFIWMLVDPRPLDMIMILLLAGPLVTLWLVWRSKGLIKVNSKRKNAHPTVVFALGAFVVGAVICILREYSIYLFPKQAWSLLITGAFLLSGISYLAVKEAIQGERLRGLILVFVVVFAGLYSYATLVFANCFYDRSTPQHWAVEVTGKHLSRGKSTTYYLHLSPWGRFITGKDHQVSRSVYYNAARGDTMDVYLRNGKWGIPWYQVEGRQATRY